MGRIQGSRQHGGVGVTVKHLDKPVAPGDPTATIPAQWINDVDEVLRRLSVYGGQVHRNGNKWTICQDEMLDTDGSIATAAGRWKTGEDTAAAAKTCYSDVIWNSAGTEQAVRLDDRSLRCDTAATRVFSWEDTTHASETPHAAFYRPVWHEEKTAHVKAATLAGLSRTFTTSTLGQWGGTDVTAIQAGISDTNGQAYTQAGVFDDTTSKRRLALNMIAVGARPHRAKFCAASDTTGTTDLNYAARFVTGTATELNVVRVLDDSATGDISISGTSYSTWGLYCANKGIYSVKAIRSDTHYQVNGIKVIGPRVVDARCDDAISTSAMDTTTAGVIDSLRDAMIAHGLIAAS